MSELKKKSPWFIHAIVLFFVILLSLNAGCENARDTEGAVSPPRDYRQEMRQFVQNISAYANNSYGPSFIVIPQNGQELLSENGEASGFPARTYINAINGVGREDLFYGYTSDNVPTPSDDMDYMLGFLNLAKTNGLQVLAIDYCWTTSYVDDSYSQSASRNFISFAADHRALDNIPSYPSTPYNVHTGDVTSLSQARNFLYLINPQNFADKDTFLNTLRATNYDALVLDLFFSNPSVQLTASDVASLKTKANGGRRLVICYMSIGEAENYRYYWQSWWKPGSPVWLRTENPNWPGNYKVYYWEKEWQSIIYGSSTSYLDKIIAAGFDGVYLDIIDAFEYFESGGNRKSISHRANSRMEKE